MIAQDFTFSEASESVRDKDAYLAPLRSGDVRIVSWKQDDVRARKYDRVGVVTGRWSLAGVYKGTQYAHLMRFTCIWITRKGT